MHRAVVSAGVAAATFILLAFALLEVSALPDSDSYYHLAVARLYATEGIVDALPWPRFSVLHDHLGDKEFLFHVLLIPFTYGDAATNGRLAIAAFNALIAGLLTWMAYEHLGAGAAALAPLLYLTAPYFWWRTIRLRPELLSLLLLLALVAAARRNRIVASAAIAALYALSYTAFHVVAGFAVLWLLATKQWKTTLAILGGLAAGLLVHPHFPHNLYIWWLQNVTLMLKKGEWDVGREIAAPSPLLLLLHNGGWWIALAVVIASMRPKLPGAFIGIPAAVFTLLQLAMERMSTYFFPFASLAALERTTRKPRPLVLVAAAAIAVAASLPVTLAFVRATHTRLPQDVERDWAELARHLPPGARVAANWGATDAYVFFAPHARYLNVLDPLFMAVKYPREYEAQRRLFEGTEPDLAGTAKNVLQSDYIAIPKWEASPALRARIAADPRLVQIYEGYHLLLRVK